MSPAWIVIGGVVALLVLLNERARIAVALVAFLIIVLAAAQMLGIDLQFWRGYRSDSASSTVSYPLPFDAR